MSILEQVYEFEKLVDIISPGYKAKVGLDTDTIVLTLNIAQIRFVKDRYLSGTSLGENIVTIYNKQDELKDLIVTNSIITPTAITASILYGIGFDVILPSDFLYYLRSDTLISRTLPNIITNKWTPNLLVENYNEMQKVLTTSYNKPILRQPVVAFKSTNSMQLIIDSYTSYTPTSAFSLDYLRKPKYLSATTNGTYTTTTCELIDYLHEEITKLAVDIYLKEYKLLLTQKESK